MTDRERLLRWMQEKGFDLDSLALVTDDSFSNLYLMLVSQKNARPISDKFKWRFAQHFGWEEATKIFADTPRATVEATVMA
jgi:hypothetical protein